ncbi:hypothetical protein CIK05_13470 [Bdellovibrio sp. qaytius]|nr:hypothetical protein CIK05_13470 [Bdellovibrio sp. qaytius]
MKTSLLSVLALLSLTILTANQAHASSGGYVFKCGISYSVENAGYSGKAESFEFASKRISNDDAEANPDRAESIVKIFGDLKTTVVYADDQIIAVSVEDLKSGLITKGKNSVALYDKKANKSYDLGCGQKVYTTNN